ncbi:MAG: hypothetical protein ABJN84_10610 [Flavobacteriaceae bacterium]
MRKISIAIVAMLLLASGSVFAKDINTVNPSKTLVTQIQKMLKDNSFEMAEDDVVAEVRFTINVEGELVVLSVDTDDDSLEGFVKGSLNYKKVNLNRITEGEIFTLSVRITA